MYENEHRLVRAHLNRKYDHIYKILDKLHPLPSEASKSPQRAKHEPPKRVKKADSSAQIPDISKRKRSAKAADDDTRQKKRKTYKSAKYVVSDDEQGNENDDEPIKRSKHTASLKLTKENDKHGKPGKTPKRTPSSKLTKVSTITRPKHSRQLTQPLIKPTGNHDRSNLKSKRSGSKQATDAIGEQARPNVLPKLTDLRGAELDEHQGQRWRRMMRGEDTEMDRVEIFAPRRWWA